MRGEDVRPTLFGSLAPEDRIPPDHPLRVDRAPIDPMLVARAPLWHPLLGLEVDDPAWRPPCSPGITTGCWCGTSPTPCGPKGCGPRTR